MTERRALIDGLKQTPTIDPKVEKEFVFQAKQIDIPNTPPATSSTVIARAPISTRIRVDLATALKRASLERQLAGIEPHRLQDILEDALEPWLKNNGYLSV